MTAVHQTDFATAAADPVRLEALHRLDVLDTAAEPVFDDLARLAASCADAPTALVSLVDRDRQWFKARVGFDKDETDISRSVCAHAIQQDDIVVIPDTTLDERTRSNPLIAEEGMRFYAGVPLIGREGFAYGTLCVIDTRPRDLSEPQRFALKTLAQQVVSQLELRRALATAQEALDGQEVLRQEIDHRVKNSLQQAAVFLRLQMRASGSEAAANALQAALRRIEGIASVHDGLARLSASVSVDLREFLNVFTGSLAKTLPEHVRLDVDIESLTVATRFASSVAILINEFVANAAKHAFPDGQDGRVSIRFLRQGTDAVLDLRDTGCGVDPLSGSAAKGLGFRIMEVCTQSLSGRLDYPEVDDGLAMRVTIPVEAIEYSGDARSDASASR